MAANGITYKVVVGSLASLLLLAGAGWVGFVAGELKELRETDRNSAIERSELRRGLSVIEERLRQLETNQQELKENQKEQKRLLEEILRRVR